jgi:hypothetical protein
VWRSRKVEIDDVYYSLPPNSAPKAGRSARTSEFDPELLVASVSYQDIIWTEATGSHYSSKFILRNSV